MYVPTAASGQMATVKVDDADGADIWRTRHVAGQGHGRQVESSNRERMTSFPTAGSSA